jgi:hypothetical protein
MYLLHVAVPQKLIAAQLRKTLFYYPNFHCHIHKGLDTGPFPEPDESCYIHLKENDVKNVNTSVGVYSKICDIWHLRDQRFARYHTFLDNRILCLMCILVYLATAWFLVTLLWLREPCITKNRKQDNSWNQLPALWCIQTTYNMNNGTYCFNLASRNPEILIIWHWRRVVCI